MLVRFANGLTRELPIADAILLIKSGVAVSVDALPVERAVSNPAHERAVVPAG